ncbi:MAG: GTP-binding protein [Candidatus Levybacteria bacterium]|nr:GTP-binding protein [Candidatus Levybacteria bacterium]
MAKIQKKVSRNEKPPRIISFVPPVVAVLGHVDHGKTTLLDAIRKTNIAQGEHGGITQKIGASKIEFIVEGQKRQITFIDTPGHEAFAKMRQRGADVADIGLLIVSSVDGVMPQTQESIKVLLEAKIPFIVVLTKSDLPEKNPEKVKQQLLKEQVLLEGYGGDTPVIEVSAKENKNIKELLELILLVMEMKKPQEKSETDSLFKAIVIEARLDKKLGAIATIIIRQGSLNVRDEIVCDEVLSRVRNMINDKGEYVKIANRGDAVEVLGLEKVPGVGSVVSKKSEAVIAPVVSQAPTLPVATPVMQSLSMPENFFLDSKPTLSIILCADSNGSLEVIANSLPKDIHIAMQKTGEVSPADILLAKSINGIILGFNIKIKPDIAKLAFQEKVLLKNYNIIYELIDEVSDVLKGKELELQEKIYGKAKVLASFPFEKTQVLGIAVLEGRIAKGDKVRLMRKEELIGESTITSVRQGKNSISKIEQKEEGGILLAPFLDFRIGDMLISHS